MTEESSYSLEALEEIVSYLKGKLRELPTIGVFCGTGLGAVIDLVDDAVILPYAEIPHFPVSTVKGHQGRLVFGKIGGASVMCMQGRFHYFEGYPLGKCVMPVRVMKLLGVHTVLLSNAAGALNPGYCIGNIMFLKDHINFLSLAGLNPLRGANDERFGPRFVAMNDAYDRELLVVAGKVARGLRMGGVQEGVYACLGGPTFETVAEVKLLQALGGDAVGMSTVHEVITARHCGLRCFAFSLITNKCVVSYESPDKPDHIEILEVGKEREEDVKNFVRALLQEIAKS